MTDEQADLAKLITLLRRAAAFQERTGVDPNAAAVDPGSALDGDDRRAYPHQLSHAAWHALTISVDHLHCLHSAVVGCQEHSPSSALLHIYAPFTLLRAGLENAATAVWLLSPAQRKERILRRLRLAAVNVWHSDAVGNLIGSPLKRTRNERLDELRRIARACGISEINAVKKPGHEEVVRAAGVATILEGDLAVVLWKGCSGLAHGDIWATLSMLDREVRQHPAASNVLNARVTAPIAGLLTVVQGTVLMVDRGFALFDRHARRHH
jgi:hypothetical protein